MRQDRLERAGRLDAARRRAHQHQRGLVEAGGRRRHRIGLTRSNVTTLERIAGEIAAVGRCGTPRRRPARSTGAGGPCASTAMCRHPARTGRRGRARSSVPSASSAMRSPGRIGATVMAPAGEAMPARASSQPASSVSASGTGAANRPATASTSKPSARLAPAPPSSSGTQASVSPASASACHSGAFQPSSLARLMVCGIGEVREDPRRRLGDDVSALAHGISLLGWRVHSFRVGYWRPIVVGTPRIGKRRGSRSSPCAPLSRMIPG